MMILACICSNYSVWFEEDDLWNVINHLHVVNGVKVPELLDQVPVDAMLL